MTYRAKPADGVAWVTGASSGIGRGVALELARRGFDVYATARRIKELDAVSLEAKGLTGSITPMPMDVTDRAGMSTTFAAIEAKRPIALAFLNAGSWFDDPPGDYGGYAFQKTFDLNVLGVANGLNPVMKAMRARKKGQIGIVGSLAGYGGLPNNGPYGPSKAAVISMAVGAKFLADQDNVNIQIINPGYVRTPLTDPRDNPKPFLMDCDIACKKIVDGLETGGFEVHFPKRLSGFLKLMNHLPYSWYFALLKRGLPKAKD